MLASSRPKCRSSRSNRRCISAPIFSRSRRQSCASTRPARMSAIRANCRTAICGPAFACGRWGLCANKLSTLLAAQEVDEDRGEKAFLLLPILEGDIDIHAVLAEHLVVFGVRHQPVRHLAGEPRMHPVMPR